MCDFRFFDITLVAQLPPGDRLWQYFASQLVLLVPSALPTGVCATLGCSRGRKGALYAGSFVVATVSSLLKSLAVAQSAKNRLVDSGLKPLKQATRRCISTSLGLSAIFPCTLSNKLQVPISRLVI